jgi:signal peptidase
MTSDAATQEQLETIASLRRKSSGRTAAEATTAHHKESLLTFFASRPGRMLRRAASVAAFGVLAVALVLAGIATVPSLFGYSTYTIDGTSMEPTLMKGDAALSQPTDVADLEIGDVIVRRDSPNGQAILHRILDIQTVDGQRAFVTQADRSEAPELDPVILSGEGDKVVYRVPYAGYILNFAGTWTGRLLLIGLPLIMLSAPFVGDALASVFSGRRRNRRSGDRASASAPRPDTPPDRGPEPDAARAPDAAAPSMPPEGTDDWVLRRFVQRHGGAALVQCSIHPSIQDMGTLQMLAALKEETGLIATVQRLAETSEELGFPFRTGSPERAAVAA